MLLTLLLAAIVALHAGIASILPAGTAGCQHASRNAIGAVARPSAWAAQLQRTSLSVSQASPWPRSVRRVPSTRAFRNKDQMNGDASVSRQDIEDFIKANDIDDDAAAYFCDCSLEVQRRVLDRADLSTARNPSSALIALVHDTRAELRGDRTSGSWASPEPPYPFSNPFSKFRMEELLPSMPERLRQLLRDQKIENASPIQAHAIPLVYKGLSAVIQSETGSGKTLAYLLPALESAREFDLKLKNPEEEEGAAILVVVPTRELGVQLLSEAEHLCHGDLALVIEAAVATWETIMSATLIIATPMELLNVLDRHDAEEVFELLGRVRTCVVDEFDELLPKKEV